VDGDEAIEASPAERFAVQDAAELKKPKRWRRLLLDAAARQAGAMLEAAHAAYAATGARDWESGVPTLEDLPAIEDAIDATGQAWEAWLDRYWVAGVDVDEGVSS
jgi:hypothetical protein